MATGVRRRVRAAGDKPGPGGAPRPSPHIPARARRVLAWARRGGLPYLFLLPALLFELLIHFVPMLLGIVISFKKLTLFFIRNWLHAPWTGLGNYRIVTEFSAPVGQALVHSFLVTCAFTVLAVGLSWLLGSAAAILAHDPFRGRGLLRALFLTPYALPVYASVITWAFMFQYDNGAVNYILHNELGILARPAFWLIGNNSFIVLVVVSVWRNWPFAFLCIMAGLQGIPQELYEASAIDGAGIWRQIRLITMPSLRSINQVVVLVLFLWTFNDFSTPFVLFGASAPPAADVISIHIYDSSFITWNFGEGSAMSVLLLCFLLLVTAGYMWFTSRGRRADA